MAPATSRHTALVTALCIDANISSRRGYERGAKGRRPGRPRRKSTRSIHRHPLLGTRIPRRLALLSGIPIPGYRAQPYETGPAAIGVIEPFMDAYRSPVESAKRVRSARKAPSGAGRFPPEILGPGYGPRLSARS